LGEQKTPPSQDKEMYGMNEDEILISRRYLKELIDFESKKLVGKALKRYEIVNDKDILKSEIKELIYESFRDFASLLEAYSKGYEIKIFKFNSGKEKCV
jgi:hypothetical protein